MSRLPTWIRDFIWQYRFFWKDVGNTRLDFYKEPVDKTHQFLQFFMDPKVLLLSSVCVLAAQLCLTLRPHEL